MPRDLDFTTLLAGRRRTRGSEPLLTYYDLTTGERTELSGTTFGNWVDKTANLLLDADVDAGDPVALDLVADHPGHWVSLVWCAAVWQVGAVVVVADSDSSADAAVRVIGPDHVTDPPTAELVLACSLHPFGLGFTPPLPAPLVDYGTEVRGFPDAFLGVPAGDGPAWVGNGRSWTQSELLAPPPDDSPDDSPDDTDVRRLIRPAEPRETVRRALLRPLRGTGSSVVVVGPASADRLAQLAATERATL